MIQARGRVFVARIAFLNLCEKREAAAIRLQRKWKSWHTWSLLPKAWKMHKNNAATIIQKFMKGYRTY